MRRFVRLLVFLVLAWVAGVLAYVISLYAIWGQTVGGDVTAILVWSALGLFVALPIIYLPLLLGLRYLRGGYQPVAAFSLLGALAGWSRPRSLYMFGVGAYVVCSRQKPAYFTFSLAFPAPSLARSWPGQKEERRQPVRGRPLRLLQHSRHVILKEIAPGSPRALMILGTNERHERC